MIINIDRKSRNINLSIKAKDHAEETEAIQKHASDSSTTAGTTNLGALLKRSWTTRTTLKGRS
jgi:small subunit ribosomal protein S1